MTKVKNTAIWIGWITKFNYHAKDVSEEADSWHTTDKNFIVNLNNGKRLMIPIEQAVAEANAICKQVREHGWESLKE